MKTVLFLVADSIQYAQVCFVLTDDLFQLFHQLLQILHAPAGEVLFDEIPFGFCLGSLANFLQIRFQGWKQRRSRLVPYHAQYFPYLLALLCLYLPAPGIARDQPDGGPG